MDRYNPLESELQVELDADTLDIVEHVLAGVFNGSYEVSCKVTAFLTKVFHKNELDGAYKVLFSIIDGWDSYDHQLIYKDNFDLDLLRVILDSSITKFVIDNQKSFEHWISSTGLDYNFDSTKGINDFTDFLYSETLRKYTDIIQYSADQVDNYLVSLSEQLRALASEKMMMKVTQVLTSSAKIGKEILSGSEKALELNRTMTAYILEKYSLTSSKQKRYEITELKDYQKVLNFRREEVVGRGGRDNFFEDLYDCQFGLLNISLMRGDICTFIGDEGVGKTKVLVEQIYYALKNKLNVLCICTETKKLVMLYMIFSRHIFEETGMRVSEVELLKLPQWIEDETNPEVKKSMEEDYSRMQEAMESLFDPEKFGTLSLMQSATYAEIYDTISTYKTNYDGTIIAIDSISFLDSKRTTEKENLDLLMKALEDSANDLGMTFLLTTHTSSDANKIAAKGKENSGVRIGAGSGYVTKISTLVIYIYTNTELAQQNRFIFSARKTRSRENTVRDVIMLRDGAVNHYEYRDDIQASTLSVDNLNDEEKYMM